MEQQVPCHVDPHSSIPAFPHFQIPFIPLQWGSTPAPLRLHSFMDICWMIHGCLLHSGSSSVMDGSSGTIHVWPAIVQKQHQLIHP